MSAISKFFGEGGCFAEACEDYRQHQVPMEIVCEASTMGERRIAYTVGWCFARVLERRRMPISESELQTIWQNKFPEGRDAFAIGFHA